MFSIEAVEFWCGWAVGVVFATACIVLENLWEQSKKETVQYMDLPIIWKEEE